MSSARSPNMAPLALRSTHSPIPESPPQLSPSDPPRLGDPAFGDMPERGSVGSDATVFPPAERSTTRESHNADHVSPDHPLPPIKQRRSTVSSAQGGGASGAGKEAMVRRVTSRFRRQSLSDAERAQRSEKEEKEKEWKGDVVTWEGLDDPMCPMNWSKGKKLKCLLLYGSATMTATFTSSIFSSSAEFIARDFGISQEVSILGLSLFIFGFAVGPILFGPISEVYGRKIAIVPAMFIFACFCAATATAKDLQTIFITRFFGGVFSSAPVTVVGGGLADIYNQRDRGSAIVVYSLCIVGGPTVAPTIGAAISESYLTWRWTEYIPVILALTVTAINAIFLPETSHAIILTRKARQIRFQTHRWALHSAHEEVDHSLYNFLHKTLLTPLKMWYQEPMVLLITTYNGFSYGILYMLFAAVPIIYGEDRGYKTVPATLPILGVLVGTIIAAAINWIYAEKFFARYLDTHNGKAPPEKRLIPMMIGSVAFPIGFFLVGWTSAKSINWFPSVMGLAFVGMSFLLIFQAGINYLIDAYTKNAASAIAANTFSRSIFGGALPLVAGPMFHNLGTDWACTLLGCLAVLLGATPFLFYTFGPKLRAKSRFAPTPQ